MAYQHAMIDIETLGKTVNAPILSVGLVPFDFANREIDTNSFHIKLSVENALKSNAEPDASTIVWWMNQSAEARHALFGTQDPYGHTQPDAMNALNQFITAYNIKYLWGNSARFDLGIIERTMQRNAINPAWEHWNERCYRTVKNFAPHIKIRRHGVHHDALDDARNQVEHLFEVADAIGLKHD